MARGPVRTKTYLLLVALAMILSFAYINAGCLSKLFTSKDVMKKLSEDLKLALHGIMITNRNGSGAGGRMDYGEEHQSDKHLHPTVPEKKEKTKCLVKRECQVSEFTFRITSGAGTTIGPELCFEDQWIMNNSLNNVGRGMNIVTINAHTGDIVDKKVFDLYGTGSAYLKVFLKKLEGIHLLMVATYDDAATHLDGEARQLLLDFGSKYANTLAFRDNWVFVGSKSKNSSHFERFVANGNRNRSKEKKWPEAISLEGCVPKA